jgi:hypothetical protein
MYFRRFAIPVVMILTLVLQFLPGTVFSPRPVAAVSCDVAQFIADVTIPDGTSLTPGATYLKTWRLMNAGTCTWTASYSAVFSGGDQMGAPAVVNLPSSVAPGATVDISVNITAPSAPGHYRGNWKLRNATGGLFGVGASGNAIFWVDIFVNTSSSFGTSYDFVASYASATWSSGGSVSKVDSPQLENGSYGNPGLLVVPQNVPGGFIQGVYPALTVQAGDRFQSLINCAYNAPNCYVNFRLNYQIGSGPVQTLWSFNERYEGLSYTVNLDLSSLAGQSVNFILYVADVSGHGTPAGDQAMWVGTKIARAGSGPIIIPPPTTTCDRGAFVADVTIPDGSIVTAGSAFTKTWRIRNVGSCTWTTDYALLYVFGTPMVAATVVNLPASVAPVVPGATADFSVNMVAPSTPGHYRSYWRFRNAGGAQFGVGSGMITFFADINVTGTAPISAPGDFSKATPALAATGVPNSTTLTWAASSNATLYEYCYDTTNDNACSTWTSAAGTSSSVLALSANTSYYWQVRAVNLVGTTYANGSSTAFWSFVTSAAPLPATSITIIDTPDPSAIGSMVDVKVTVSGGSTVPTGNVTISGADVNCAAPIHLDAAGSGACNVSFNANGTRTLTATYSGDASHAGSTATASHVVSNLMGSTTHIFAYTPEPSVPGGNVTVKVQVSGGGTIPTGTVTLSGADVPCGPIALDITTGIGQCDMVFNNAGTYTIRADYSGNANYLASFDTEPHTVKGGSATSATNITAHNINPSHPGEMVVVEATVSGAGLTVPSGLVAITGADVNCTITLNPATGIGSCPVTFNTAGDKTLTAKYGGNTIYDISSGTKGHTVLKGSTTTNILTVLPEPSKPGEAVTVSFEVLGGGVKPQGTVTVSGADIPCTIPLSGGTGSCSVTFTTIGPHPVTATYSGDDNYLPSTSAAHAHEVVNATTTAVTTVLAEPSKTGETLTMLSVKVTGAGVSPSGTVVVTGADSACTIGLGAGPLGTAIGSCPGPVFFSTAGAKLLTATYSGDANYAPSVGTYNHTVNKNDSLTTITLPYDPASSPVPNVSVKVTVRVTGSVPNGAFPTRTVAISTSGPGVPCTITLIADTPGTAIGFCSVTITATGDFTVYATYSGDANYNGSSFSSPAFYHVGP